MNETMQIEGQKIFAWIQLCKESDRTLLVGTEFANNDDVWLVTGIDREWIELERTSDGAPSRKKLTFVLDGDFFIGAGISDQLEASRREVMSPGELAIEEAREKLLSTGLRASVLGASDAQFLAALISEFRDHSFPDHDEWMRLHHLITEGPTENMRAIAPLLRKWLERSESELGHYDLFRRILLAVVYRHSGQLQKGIDISDVVDEHGKCPNDQSSIAILCTTRAASLMDVAELGSKSPCEILSMARKSLNRAYAIRGSEEVMLTYRRMKVLDQRFGCEGRNRS